jgi:hypothetical protein
MFNGKQASRLLSELQSFSAQLDEASSVGRWWSKLPFCFEASIQYVQKSKLNSTYYTRLICILGI